MGGGQTTTGTFTKITSLSDLTTGQYVIVGAQKVAGLGKLTYGTLSSGRIPYTQDYTSAPASITNPAGASVWDVTVSGTSVTLYNAENEKYIADAGSGKLKYAATGMSFTAACNEGVFSLASGTYFLCVNASSNYWRNYAASTGYNSGVCLYFYKKQTTPTHTLTLSATNGSITAMNGETVIESCDNVEEGAELDITATANDWYKFSGWNVSGTGSTLGSTTENPTTFTMGTADATLTATFAACVVTVSSNDENWGITDYNSETHIISTTAEDGYRISSTEPYTIAPADAATLTAGDDDTFVVSGVKDQDVEITINFEALPSDPYTVKFNAGTNGTCLTTELTESSAGAGVTLPEVTPNTGYQFVGWATTNTATEADAGVAGATYYPTANITLYAVYNQVYTITWSVNGTPTTDGNPTTSVVEGEGITTLPTAPSDISEMKFQGWTATQIGTPSATAPTDLFTDAEHAPAITNNTTFYAVFAEESEGDVTWNKVSAVANVEVGEYVIINNSFYLPNTTTSSAPSQVAAPTITDNKIANTDVTAAMQWSLSDAGEGKFYVKNSGGDYLYATSDNNGIRVGKTSDTWTFEANNDALAMKESSNSRYCATYKSGSDWRSYTSANHSNYGDGGKLYLYKKTAGAPTYSNYCTTVVTKVLTSISLSGDYPTEFWKGETFNHDGITVTAHYENAEDEDVTEKAEFTGYDMATAGEQTVTVTYDTKSITYDITVKTIANTAATAYTIAQAIDIIEAGKDLQSSVYVAGIISQIDEFNSQYHNMTYWIEDESTETEFEVYRGKNLNNTDFNDENDIVIRANVIIYGKITKYNSTYEFSQDNYLVSYTAPQSYGITLNQSIGGTISADKETAAAGETVTITIEPASGYTLATLTGAAFNETVDPALLTYTFTMPAEEVTINATFNAVPTYTISFATNGIAETEATIVVNQGDAIGTLAEPTGTNIPNGYTFRGWNAGDVALTDVEPTYVTAETVPTDDMTLYAVFAIAEVSGTTALNKMGAGDVLNNGDNIVIVATGNDWAKALYQETVSSSYVNFYDFTGDVNDVIANSKKYVTLNTATEGKWKLGDATNGYVYNASSNNLTIDTKNSTEWTISWNNTESKYSIKNNDRWLSCRNDLSGDNQYKFRGGGTTTPNGTVYFDLYKLTTSTTTYSNFCTTVTSITENTTISGNTVWKGNYTINGNTVTIGSGAVLTVKGALTNTNAANLVIEDGAQLIVNNTGVQATMKKDITSSTASKESNVNWFTISSPLATNTAFANVTGLIPTTVTALDYDLYRLDEENGIWVNSKVYDTDDQTIIANKDFTTIDKGVGYIYHNTKNTELAFAGEINVAPAKCTLTNNKTKGFNLIGNPFAQNIKLSDVKAETAVLAKGFYVLTNQNTWGTELTTEEIKPLQGFLVQATTAVDVTISKPTAAPSKGERSGKKTANIEVVVSNASYKDNAYAMFGEGTGLNKVSHRNAEAPMLYIPQDGEDFAIAFMSENTTVFPVSFKAMTTGKYSISLKATNDVNTLVLIDNMTGVETNMLLEGSYSFIGSPADNDSRFTVKLSISHNSGQTDSEHFVYQNGSELVVNGEGTLQVFDVLGRVVISEEVHGQTVNVGGLSKGAYIVRMTGNEVKTQKIIVR